MINVIFKTATSFNASPNSLLPINDDYSFEECNYLFGDLSKTNIFIGANNSGKSRFLRHLFENSFLCITDDNIEKFYSSLARHLDSDSLKDKCGLEKIKMIYEIANRGQSHYNHSGDFFRNLKGLTHTVEQKNKYYFPTVRGVKDYKSILNEKLNKFSKSVSSIQNKDSIYHYISLLNLEKDGLESFDIYSEITKHEYFPNKSLNIITGGNLYRKIKSMLLGNEEQRKMISEFQLFLRDNFFSDYESVQLIPYEDQKVLYVKIGDDERAIYDWGDGTQQLIVILFSLFIHKDEEDNLFYIEEPEIYLHPGILRKFIEVINSCIFSKHQYFITTHSNIILDTSADSGIDMSIFKFKKSKEGAKPSKFVIEQCDRGDGSLLNELGVRNSSVFLSNCSIWVEGITDRLYLKHYLKLYLQKHGKINSLREGIDYTFIEYGGGNIVHFNFSEENSKNDINAKYINNRIFLIADNDNTKQGSKKTERKVHLKEVLGDNFYELPVTEIENLLSQKTIEQILKKQNPKHTIIIDQKFSEDRTYKRVKLGKYLDTLFKDTGIKKYSGESGTIKNKLDFCQTAIEFITEYDMLTDEAKDLVEKVVGFINANN